MAEAKENAPPLPARPPVLGLKRRGTFNAPSFVAGSKKPAVAPAGATKPLPARPPAASAATAPGPSKPGPSSTSAPHGEALYFMVLYCKYQPNKKLRKNKSFADGIMEVAIDTKRATLLDGEGRQVSVSVLRGVNVPTMGAGSSVVVGQWEVEVEEPADAEKFRSGQLFLKSTAAAVLAAAPAVVARKPAAGAGFKPPAGAGGFKRPGLTGAAPAPSDSQRPQWLHNPHAEGAIVLNRQQWADGKGLLARGKPVCPVVLDGYIAKQLRPHQLEGVQFLYSTTMGLRTPGMAGCILADEMGLGKTLQVLALIWTLLRQGPEGKPAVRKAMVVTPSSLTQNWADEARKWLGPERMNVMVLSPGPESKQQVVDFKHGSVWRVVAVSYETLRKHAAELAGTVDLLVCDEGHRLKSAQGNKTISALASLSCPRRVLLTGTPLQNNLGEFFSMVNFACPNALGSLAVFDRVLAAPINRSRDRNASEEERALGAARSAELSRRVEAFVLRRTREVNAQYLPPLSSYVVFCRPTEAQLRLYSSELGSSSVRKLLSTTGADFGDQALSVLTRLRKICNHPALYAPAGAAAEAGGAGHNVEFDANQSGKMAALGLLLQESIAGAGERVVVVSQSTAALDLVQKLCDARGFATVRIDGGTDVAKRQDVVNSFNRYNVGQVFLLSTTAGGAGLNLVGANRLALLDSHWNPAMDQQAMARVWRDGQKKPCVVYRLLTTGTLDEKMYQRQLKKGDIAATMMGGGGGGGGSKGGGKFSKEELKQLFTLRNDTACDTFDLLSTAAAAEGRQRQQAGGTDGDAAEGMAAAAAEFRDVAAECEDAPLCAAIAAGHVTFVHRDKAQQPAASAVAAAQPAAEGGGSGEAAEESVDCLELEEDEGGDASAGADSLFFAW